ncbi:uncharacterized protein DUF4256 [Pseudoduganella flava]|uniref:DUF4256 family protein n=1 Tax=Pseudoduganella flava TaxID=871742 RepID=A0A562Q022_9BURK|nr:DUF4256 domain-containing protein [Pseudoduganella flava]QGZ38636.1 DUF4256 family protein [Pseudoduganella flava]TWI49790.1 uncharacterized protein DUF4256 [Pseudoduganella flava]
MTAPSDNNLIATLQARFASHPERHAGIDWASVQARLDAHPDALRTLREMERTGGEPDVVALDETSGAIVFCDCSAESPAGRRSLCYDAAALAARKENKPAGSAVVLAGEIGMTLLSEEQYRHLQTLGEFDRKTSSWLHTPDSVRQQGGALFGDRRYGRVFVYHNGAESYYAARGLRGSVTV